MLLVFVPFPFRVQLILLLWGAMQNVFVPSCQVVGPTWRWRGHWEHQSEHELLPSAEVPNFRIQHNIALRGIRTMCRVPAWVNHKRVSASSRRIYSLGSHVVALAAPNLTNVCASLHVSVDLCPVLKKEEKCVFRPEFWKPQTHMHCSSNPSFTNAPIELRTRGRALL